MYQAPTWVAPALHRGDPLAEKIGNSKTNFNPQVLFINCRVWILVSALRTRQPSIIIIIRTSSFSFLSKIFGFSTDYKRVFLMGFVFESFWLNQINCRTQINELYESFPSWIDFKFIFIRLYSQFKVEQNIGPSKLCQVRLEISREATSRQILASSQLPSCHWMSLSAEICYQCQHSLNSSLTILSVEMSNHTGGYFSCTLTSSQFKCPLSSVGHKCLDLQQM